MKLNLHYYLSASVIIIIALLSACNSPKPTKNTEIEHLLRQKIDSIIFNQKVDLGIAIADDSSIVYSLNADKAFPMMSVYKLHVAMAVIHEVEAGHISLNQKVDISPDMLILDTYSPMLALSKLEFTVNDLLKLSLNMSDNNACDILINLVGGTSYVNDYIHRFGVTNTQILWTEADMHEEMLRFSDNFTTPHDAIMVLRQAYRMPWIKDCLINCQTGENRIPKHLPKGENAPIVGHKTGSGPNIEGKFIGINDIGFVITPNRKKYYIAVFCNNSYLSLQETESIIAQISQAAYQFLSTNTNGAF